MHNVGEKELYKIINRALSKIGEIRDEPINKEFSIFKERYNHYIQQYPCPSLFEEPRLTNQDIFVAKDFFDALEAYRLATDVHAKETPELSISHSRSLYNGLDRYKEHISSDNKMIVQGMLKTAKSILPEFREEYILERYNEQANLIYKLKKISKLDCERLVVDFFENVLNDTELKNVKICPQKIELYENTLKIVNYLPTNKYNKTYKLQLKSNLHYAIFRGIWALPNPDKEKAKKAHEECIRYKNAAENISRYIENSKNSEVLRRKRLNDEWRYK